MTAKQMFDEATSLFEAALAQSRVERAASEARIARLRHAAELEKQGRYEEARPIIEAIRSEQ